MGDSVKLNLKIALFKEGDFRKQSIQQMNINNLKKFSLAGKSKDESGNVDYVRQRSPNVKNSERKEVTSNVDATIQQKDIPPPPKLRRKSPNCDVRLCVKSNNLSELATKSKCFNSLDHVKKSEQIVNLTTLDTGNKDVDVKVTKTKPLPPPPPLLPMPMATTTVKLPSITGSSVAVAEPKIIKKGDTVIKSYIDEKTGKIAVYEPGIKLEVCHSDSGKWYPAKVIQVDLKEAEVLIHYEKWSSRFDEWIKMDSSRLRPSANTNVVKVEFKVGEKVEAIWNTDGQRYPGVIIQVFPLQDYYEVQFDDGIKCKKKSNQIFKIKRVRGRPPADSSSPLTAAPTVLASQESVVSVQSPNAVATNNDAVELSKSTALTVPKAVVTPSTPLSSTVNPTKSTAPVHFSIFTPPSGDLGKRKRTIQDYSALLKRPSKSLSYESEETNSSEDIAIVPGSRKKKRQSLDTTVSKVPVDNSSSETVHENESVMKSDAASVCSKSSIAPSVTVPNKVTDGADLPAKRIRKPSRRFSSLNDDHVYIYSESKKFKTRNTKTVTVPPVPSISETTNTETLNDDAAVEVKARKSISVKEEGLNGICKDTSSPSPDCTSPIFVDYNDDSFSDATEDDKGPSVTSDPSLLTASGKTRRRGRIQFRTKIPSDLDNLEIPPPPASGYRLKKLYLEIEKVNDVNIQQVVSDPEGIIFKLNDPVPEGWRKEAQLKFRNETYPKWFISYVSPAGDRFRYLKQMHKLIQEANFDFTPFDFRPLNPRLQEIAKLVSGGQYSYKRRTNMPPPPLLSELETSPGVGVVSIQPKLSRRLSVTVPPSPKISSPSPQLAFDSKIDSGFVDAEGNDVTIEQGEDGGWACPVSGCDKHFRKDSLLQMHLKHYHPEMKIKPRGGVKIANVVEMAKARTAFDYDEPNFNATKALPSLAESELSIPTVGVPALSNQPTTEPSENICKKSNSKKTRTDEQVPDENSPVKPTTEISSECKMDIKLETVEIDIEDNKNDDEQMMEDSFTDAVEVSASDYKKPRINLRRKFFNKRMGFRLPVRNSLKNDSKTMKKQLMEDVPDSETTGTSRKIDALQSMSKVQIIVEKCDEPTSSLANRGSPSSTTVNSAPKTLISNAANNLRRPRFSNKRNNSLLKSILKRQMKASSLKVQRARNFVQSRRGRGRARVPKPVEYFSGLSRKQVNRIRQYMVENNIPIRFQGEPTVKDVKVEIINCICKGTDEFGMMVQCELCHCWQHGNCFGFYEDDDLPKYYVCESCKNPGHVSRTKFWEWHIPGYYKTGQLPSFPEGPALNFSNEVTRSMCNDVKKWIMNTVDSIENCSLKLRIAQKKPDHPKLYQWETPSENPLKQKQIRDFRKTYRPWLFRRVKALQNGDEDYKKNVKKAYLKHLHWKKFQVLVEDFKWGIRSLDPKFLIILNKLSIYQRWKVQNTMEERRRLNLIDKETMQTNPFAIWARKHRQRQQWEIKMRKHAHILENELKLDELMMTSEMLLASAASFKGDKTGGPPVISNIKQINTNDQKVDSPCRVASVTKSNEDQTMFSFHDETRPNNIKLYSSREFNLSFCSKCRSRAGKRWDWSEFSDNGDDFFGKNCVSKKDIKQTKTDQITTYEPKTLKYLCEKVISGLKVEKRRISLPDKELSDNLNDHIKDNLDSSRDDTKYLSDEFNCSDTTESIDCDDSLHQDGLNIEEDECIRCYLISVSLSKDPSFLPQIGSGGLSGLNNRYQNLELEKFSAVSHRDILTFLSLSDAIRQSMWDSIENSLPYIPITPRRYPTIRRKERNSVRKIIRHYNSELKRYWTRMFNIKLRGVDLMMQKQTWADELVRIYSEIHLILEDMRKDIEDSTQVDKLGDVLLRKIDIFRSICGTPDHSPLENLNTRAEISNLKTSNTKGVCIEGNDDTKLTKEALSNPCVTLTETSNNKACSNNELLNTEKNCNDLASDSERAIMELVESCISKVETETLVSAVNSKESNLNNNFSADLEEKIENCIDNPNTTNIHSKSTTPAPIIFSSHTIKSENEEIPSLPETEMVGVDQRESSDQLNKSSAKSDNEPTFTSKSELGANWQTPVNECHILCAGSSSSILPLAETDNDALLESLPDVNVPDCDIDTNLNLLSDPAFMEPMSGSRWKRTIFPKISAPFIKKLTAESCRENLLQNILRQQELIDAHLDKLEEKVCELERKYTKRKVDPMSTKKYVQAVQSMVHYNKKLNFLKRNALLFCGGEPSRANVNQFGAEVKQESNSSSDNYDSDDNEDDDEDCNEPLICNSKSLLHLNANSSSKSLLHLNANSSEITGREIRISRTYESNKSTQKQSLLKSRSNEKDDSHANCSQKSKTESGVTRIMANSDQGSTKNEMDSVKSSENTSASANATSGEFDYVNDPCDDDDEEDQDDPDYTQDDEDEEFLDN